MMGEMKKSRSWRSIVLCCGAFAAFGVTGCQVDVGGQTLPSPYYLKDDVQYHPEGSQFRLAKEAAAMKAYNAQATSQQAAQQTTAR